MQECLKLFDEQLAASESSSLSSPSSPSSGSSPQTQTTTTVSKRKKRIPKVLVEGLEIKEPQWALIDGSKAVIHIMTKKARKTWQVEGVASDFSEVSREIDRIGDEEEDHQRDLRKEEISEHAHTGHGFGDKTGTSDSRRETGEFQPRL